MLKRTILISSPAKLSVSLNQLSIEARARENPPPVPIEDIGILLIENQQVSITVPLITKIAEAKGVIVYTDEKYMPTTYSLPFHSNHTYTEKLHQQLEVSQPLRKQLWKQTVECKIHNQMEVMKFWGADITKMSYFKEAVKSGDTTNVEGQVAAIYWEYMLEHFEVTRKRNGPPPNNFLNYGYAILRSIVARSLSISGGLLSLGLHHKNKYNPYCLADDIMEPFRPIIDQWIWLYLEEQYGTDLPEKLTKEDKIHLLQIPTLDTVLNKKKYPLLVGMQTVTSSLMDCFNGQLKKIVYPILSQNDLKI